MQYLVVLFVLLSNFLVWRFGLRGYSSKFINKTQKIKRILFSVVAAFIVPYILCLVVFGLIHYNTTLLTDDVFMYAMFLFSTSLFTNMFKIFPYEN